MGSHPGLVKGVLKLCFMQFNCKDTEMVLGKKNEEGAFAKRWNGNDFLWNPVQNSNEIFCKLLSILLIEVQKDPRLLFIMFPIILFPFSRSQGDHRRVYEWRVERNGPACQG